MQGGVPREHDGAGTLQINPFLTGLAKDGSSGAFYVAESSRVSSELTRVIRQAHDW